jgi:hypothetical protein
MHAEASRLPSHPLSGVDAIDHLISLQACRAASRRWLLEDVLHGVDWLISMERCLLVNLNGTASTG